MNNLVESVKLIWPSPLTHNCLGLCSGGDDGNDGSVSVFPRRHLMRRVSGVDAGKSMAALSK